jgi:hypothetical protein
MTVRRHSQSRSPVRPSLPRHLPDRRPGPDAGAIKVTPARPRPWVAEISLLAGTCRRVKQQMPGFRCQQPATPKDRAC